MADSHAHPDAATESGSSKPATYRLVIRAKILPEETPPPDPPRSDRRMLAIVVGCIAALLALAWIGVSVFRSDSPSAQPASQGAKDAEAHASTTAPAPEDAASVSTDAPPATQPDPSPSPINEVLPDVSRSALQTIRGTIRVSIRLTIDKQGTVIAATVDEPGPSRYFERRAVEAARKWTFASAATDEPRNMLVRFSFTRERVTARTEP